MGPQKRWGFFYRCACALMDVFNQTTAQVCATEGIDCIDLAGALPKDESMFFDDLHLTDAGCEKVAAVVADYFVAKLRNSQQTH